MPLVQNLHSDLAYIDDAPSEAQLGAAQACIAQELAAATNESSELHPDVPCDYEPAFSDIVQAAHAQIAASGKPRAEDQGISLDRYEAPDPPDSTATAQDREDWKHALRMAATNQQYLSQRALNLGLLETYGKNTWLIGNSQLEDSLRTLERDVKVATDASVRIEDERRARQLEVQGEIQGLQETFKLHLGRAVEAEIATAALKNQLRTAGSNTKV